MIDFIRSNPIFIASAIFMAFSIPIVVWDIRTMKIPDMLVYVGAAILSAYFIAFTGWDAILHLVAAALSFGLFMLVRKFAGNGLGWGDVKYSLVCGLYAGPLWAFAGYILSAVYCGLFFLVLKLSGRYGKDRALPFTPFMALGTVSVSAIPIVKQLAC